MSRRTKVALALALVLWALWIAGSAIYWSRNSISFSIGSIPVSWTPGGWWYAVPVLLVLLLGALARKEGQLNAWVAFGRTVRLIRLACYGYAVWWGGNYVSRTWNADISTVGTLLIWVLPPVAEIGLTLIGAYLLGRLAAWSDTRPTEAVLNLISFRR